jgi:TIR domain
VGDKIVRHLFLSWCHADQPAKEALMALLRDNLSILRGVEFQWWEDSFIGIGEDWRRQIQAQLDQCHYGLLLLSPRFFASGFITEHELPRFVGEFAAKGALPVALKRVPMDGSRDMRGVDQLQIFTAGGKAFEELRGADRSKFAGDLASAIRTRVLGDA